MDGKEIVSTLAKENTSEYNMMKVIEECTELSEVLIKKLNKKGREKEPTDKDIIDEIGDVFIRIRILAEQIDFQAVDKRIEYKLSRLLKWYQSENFKGNC